MNVGDRYLIPQWEHTSHCGFVEVIDIGSLGRREGKVRLLFPDLTSPWVSRRRFEKEGYPLVRRGSGKFDLRGELGDFWVEGEQEDVYTPIRRYVDLEGRLPGRRSQYRGER